MLQNDTECLPACMSHSALHKCRTPATSQDPSREDQEAEENDKNLSKHGRELQRLLKNTGLSESDEEVLCIMCSLAA